MAAQRQGRSARPHVRRVQRAHDNNAGGGGCTDSEDQRPVARCRLVDNDAR
jgi:hypothetical protein